MEETKYVKDYDYKLASDFIKKWEGLRLKTYHCTSWIKTIGYGHTKGVKENQEITVEEADKFLDDDLFDHFYDLKSLVTVKVTEGQFIALMSFIFNLGSANLKSSTLLKKLNQGDYDGASKEFPRWCYSGKKIVQGILNRRNAEVKLFNDYRSNN